MSSGDDDGIYLLAYASQTGQAEAISEEVASLSLDHGFTADLHAMNTVDKEFSLEDTTIAVFIASTTGDGDPPDNATKFYRRLRKKTLAPTHLSQLRFAILGLGDSNYNSFCNYGKTLNTRLLELGATHFYPPAWADDVMGLETVVEPWMEGLFPAIKKEMQTQKSTRPEEQRGDITTDKSREEQTNGTTTHKPGEEQINNTIIDTVTDALDRVVVSDLKTNGVERPADTSRSEMITYSNGTGSNGVDAVPSEASTMADAMQTVDESVSGDCEECLRYSKSSIGTEELSLPAVPPRYLLSSYAADQTEIYSDIHPQNKHPYPSSDTPVTVATVATSTTITAPDAVKETLLMELDISSCGWNYEVGDAMSIVCPNSKQEVQRIINRLQGNISRVADDVFETTVIAGTTKRNAAVPPYVPVHCTPRHILTHCLDIRAVPKKLFIRALCEVTTDNKEKRRLQELCSRNGASQYHTHIREGNISLLDILDTFTTCTPTLDLLIEHLPRLQPRPYSIASSPLHNKHKISIAFNIIDIPLPTPPSPAGRTYARRGVCTGWLSKLTVGDEMKVFLRNNQTFRLPSDPATPIVMVGPGTGVTPFVGFLQHRQHLMEQSGGALLGRSMLFFGCRHKHKDFLFQQELKSYVSRSTLSQLHVCFSRDNCGPESLPPATHAIPPEDPTSIRYVQDMIRLHSAAVIDALYCQHAVLYVCGDASGMSKGVYSAVKDCLCKETGLSETESVAYLADMKQSGRYHEDVWA